MADTTTHRTATAPGAALSDSERRGRRRERLRRAGLYTVLTVVGLGLLFPFLVVAGASLKARDDIFRYPPRLLPYSQDVAEVAGQDEALPLYDIDGEERVLLEGVGG